MNVKQGLLACADRLEKTGWCQLVGLDLEGRMCSIGVIDEVVLLAHQGDSNLYLAVRDALAAHLGIDKYRVIDWNDEPGRTKEEVVAAFRGAAEALESAS